MGESWRPLKFRPDSQGTPKPSASLTGRLTVSVGSSSAHALRRIPHASNYGEQPQCSSTPSLLAEQPRLSGSAPPEVSDFDLAWLERGVEVRKPLGYAAEVAFEEAAPVRDFPLYRGQRHFRACTGRRRQGRHVGFESWLERDHAILMDFDPQVVGFASQPFWLFWRDEASGRGRSRAGLLRAGSRRHGSGGGLPPGGPHRCPVRGCVRRDTPRLRTAGLGLSAGQGDRCGAGSESALARRFTWRHARSLLATRGAVPPTRAPSRRRSRTC